MTLKGLCFEDYSPDKYPHIIKVGFFNCINIHTHAHTHINIKNIYELISGNPCQQQFKSTAASI